MNRKNKAAAGMTFGISMAIFFVLRNFLIKEHQSATQIARSILVGIIAGAIAGILFGWLIGMFSKSKLVNDSAKINIEPGENILFETPATHFKGIEGVGGKLYLTNKRLIFKSHKFNIQNHELSIDLADINKAENYNALNIVNQGLLITTKYNTSEKFVTEKTGEWISILNERKNLQVV